VCVEGCPLHTGGGLCGWDPDGLCPGDDFPFLPRDVLCIVQSAVLRSHVVCPSVTLVICDHIGWKSWKVIARTISPAPSLFVAKRRST